MREQDHLAALVGDFLDGLRHALDARDVGDPAVLHRHVEIDAHEHALAGKIGGIEGSEVCSHSSGVRCSRYVELDPCRSASPTVPAGTQKR
jgi:hypothetical protein